MRWRKCESAALCVCPGEVEVSFSCVDHESKAVVTEGQCGETSKPERRLEACNQTPCPPVWRYKAGACSTSCGGGVTQRVLYCARDGEEGEEVLNGTECWAAPKPEEQEPCSLHPCPPRWRVSDAGRCSATCGFGVAERSVTCVQFDRGTDIEVAETQCSAAGKPPTQIPCMVSACTFSWAVQNWTESRTTSPTVTTLGSSPEDDVPHIPANLSFMVPKKEIHMVPDMGKWKRSQAYVDYIGFILTLNEGVKGKKLTCEYNVSESIENLLALLNTLDRWIDETPPIDQPSRFGNKAFRLWYTKLDQEAENLLRSVIPPALGAAVPEVALYLKEAVGNSTRIDYGTGHEAAFAAFLCCLCKIGVLRVDDQLAIVFRVFDRYLKLMRKLQKTYRMEPAGSQGVWGLDDFQFLPFIWGSSQLVDHPTLEPRHFVDEKIVNEHHKDYMFMECVKFINEPIGGPRGIAVTNQNALFAEPCSVSPHLFTVSHVSFTGVGRVTGDILLDGANPSRGQEFSDEAFSGSIVRVCRALSAVKELCHVVRCALSTKAREGTVDITLISSSQQPGEVHNHSAS
ncbi:UNVERIFIED_CONTAM: hypothetical protein FKN15_026988 [Acipenser sinensis]